jgi:hypothetical protein
MHETKLSRRTALQIFGAVPVVSAALAACGGGKKGPESCSDVSALSDAEKTARSALQYTDHSAQPDKHCNTCNLFQAPADASQCGSCQIVKGPIHPDGYCTGWVKKA